MDFQEKMNELVSNYKQEQTESVVKKFLKVFVGSRGCLEEVEVVEDSYDELCDFYDEQFIGYEDEEYVEEFCGIDVDKEKGLISISLNEEEGVWYVDMDINEEFCNELIELSDKDENDKVIEKMWDFVG